MWFCPNCDATLGDFQSACDKCGTPRPLVNEAEEEQVQFAQDAEEKAAREKERGAPKVTEEDEADYQEPLPSPGPRRERGVASGIFLVLAVIGTLWFASGLFSVFTNPAFQASINAYSIFSLFMVCIPMFGFVLATYALSRMAQDMHRMKQDMQALREKLLPEKSESE